jgi:hypothetical protein
MRKPVWTILGVVVLAVLLVAPNAYWLERSSAKIHNIGNTGVTLRIALSDDPAKTIEIGTLPPGASRFQWIYPVGEATLGVEVRDKAEWRRHCNEYIEAGMYRVEITVTAPDQVACSTELPFLGRLLILDMMS